MRVLLYKVVAIALLSPLTIYPSPREGAFCVKLEHFGVTVNKQEQQQQQHLTPCVKSDPAFWK